LVTLPISPAALHFLQKCAESLIDLEILLLLYREPRVWRGAEAVARQLGVALESAEQALEKLGARNLLDVRIASTLVYRFAPVDKSILPLLTEVAQAQSRHPRMLEQLAPLLESRRGRS
jgi:hypothetical protein